MTSANIYLIQYTGSTSGTTPDISSTQTTLIQTFLYNIFSSQYWNTIKQYTAAGTPATPVYQKTTTVTPGTSVSGKTLGTTVNSGSSATNGNDEEYILLSTFNSGSMPKDTNGIYIVLLGTDITYKYSGNVMGQGSAVYCGRHDAYITNGQNYYYAVVGMPGNGSKCHIFPFITANGDSSVDNAINLILHEVTESVLSFPYGVPGVSGSCASYNSCNGAYTDACSLQISDKCLNAVSNLVATGATSCSWGATMPNPIPSGQYLTGQYYNVAFGANVFTVQPIWDNKNWVCSMGGSTPTKAVSGNPGKFCSSCTASGAAAIFSIPPSGKVGKLTSGVNWSGSSTISASSASLSMQTDGNICVKSSNLATQYWCSNSGASGGPFNLAMQPDGNLVAYNSAGSAIWNAGTGGHYNNNYCAVLGTDNKLRILDPNCNQLWST